MQLKKVILSLVLLLAYSAGFAHDFVPHHHDQADRSNYTDHHGHDIVPCIYDGNRAVDYGHLKCKEYHEDGVLASLACMLAQVEHPHSQNEYFYYLDKKNGISGNSILKARPTALLIIPFNINSDNSDIGFLHFELVIITISATLPSTCHRGPPSFLC